MGITGLLKKLNEALEPINISQFSGKRVGIDASFFIYRGTYHAFNLQAAGKRCIAYFIKYITMLQRHNIIPLFVFDGKKLPVKQHTYENRAKQLKTQQEKWKNVCTRGKRISGTLCSRMIRNQVNRVIIRLLRDMNVPYVVAPYEADAQLRFEELQGNIDLVITDDSDLVVYGCQNVLYKMNTNGDGLLYQKTNLRRCKDLVPNKYSFDRFQQMCVLSGCDYAKSICGIGLVKAKTTVDRCKLFNIEAGVNIINQLFHLEIPPDYVAKYEQAIQTFHHQIVYNRWTEERCPLTPYPTHQSEEDFLFAGVNCDQFRAKDYADGTKDAVTEEPLETLQFPSYHFDQNSVELEFDSGIQIPKMKKFRECRVCGKVLTSNYSFARHKIFHMGMKNINCTICGIQLSTIHSLKRHTFAKHGIMEFANDSFSIHTCEVCGRVFIRKDELSQHENRHLKINMFKCNICGADFSYRSSLSRHKSTRHASIPEVTIEMSDDTLPDNSNKVINNDSDVNQKFVDKNGESVFIRKDELSQHENRHSEIKKFKCNICGAEFKQRTGLSRHKSTRHEAITDVTIEMSDDTLPNNSNNVINNDLDVNQKFVDKNDERVFIRKDELSQHENISTQIIEHICGRCHASFTTQCHLEAHQKIHAGKPDFVCKLCGKSFTRKDSLSRHEKGHTGVKK